MRESKRLQVCSSLLERNSVCKILGHVKILPGGTIPLPTAFLMKPPLRHYPAERWTLRFPPRCFRNSIRALLQNNLYSAFALVHSEEAPHEQSSWNESYNLRNQGLSVYCLSPWTRLERPGARVKLSAVSHRVRGKGIRISWFGDDSAFALNSL